MPGGARARARAAGGAGAAAGGARACAGAPARVGGVPRAGSAPRAFRFARAGGDGGAGGAGGPGAAPAEAAPAGGAGADARFEGLRVLVAGATGGTGRLVVEELLKESVPVVALVRNAEKARRDLPPEVEVVEGDVTQFSSVARAYAGCNAVVCCTGARPSPTDPAAPFAVDCAGTANLVAAAQNDAGGCRSFVLVSSVGADELINPLNLAWGVLFWKKRGEEALQRSGLRYTVVRPGGLSDGGRGRGRGRGGGGGKSLKKGRVTMAPAGTYGLAPGKESPGSILRAQVAAVAAAALVEEAAAGKVVELAVSRSAASGGDDFAAAFASVP